MAAVARVVDLGMRNRPFPFFDRIADGRKTVEVRYQSGYIGQIGIGSTIRFYCGPKEIFRRVTDIRKYSTYEDLLAKEDLGKVIPGIDSVDKALAVYRTFPSYKYAKKGAPPKVLAIELAEVDQGKKRKAEEMTGPVTHQERPKVQER